MIELLREHPLHFERPNLFFQPLDLIPDLALEALVGLLAQGKGEIFEIFRLLQSGLKGLDGGQEPIFLGNDLLGSLLILPEFNASTLVL